jgi:hypothetical protein
MGIEHPARSYASDTAVPRTDPPCKASDLHGNPLRSETAYRITSLTAWQANPAPMCPASARGHTSATAAWRSHLRSVSGLIPSRQAIALIAAYSDG